MELYQVRQLVAVARCGSLSKAAEAVHTSQPALSRSMKLLEQELGVALFDRSKNRITLNKMGSLAVSHAQVVIAAYDEMVRAVQDADRKSRTFSYGSIAPAPMWHLTPVASQVYKGQAIRAELQDTESALVQGLDDGTYNLIVLLHALDGKAYHSQPFMRERLSVMLPTGHPLARRDGIYLKDLAGEKILIHSDIGFWYDLCKRKIPGAEFLEQNALSSLREIVKTAALPSFATNQSLQADAAVPQGKTIVPLLDKEVDVRFWCVCKKEAAPQHKALFLALGTG